MKFSPLVTVAIVLSLTSSIATAEQKKEGRELAERGFAAIDTNKKGFVHMGDLEVFRELVFVSMDGDENKKVTRSEFLNWDYGFQLIAENRDRKSAYDAAKKVIFSFWDRNGDGVMTTSEHRQSVIADFQRADVDHDGLLTENEFTSGFSIMSAMRAALTDN